MKPFIPLSANHKSKFRNQKCFTLIELLVVVAIIAVLVAMLLPALASARLQAKILLCSNHLRQWGTIHTMFAHENNDRFVRVGRMDPKSPEIVHYYEYNMRFIDKYKLTEKLFYCPLYPDWYPQYWNLKDWGGDWKYYSMIGYTYLGAYDPPENYPYFLDGYASPIRLDASESWWVLMTDFCRGEWIYFNNHPAANHIIHGELATTVLCVDGHVVHQVGGLQPYFYANGFVVQWRKTL